MIKLPGKHRISSVLISTAFGHSGSGFFPYLLFPSYTYLLERVQATRTTVIAKSATLQRRIGNFNHWKPWTWRTVRRLTEGGMLNAYGLTNGGVHHCAKKILTSHDMGIQVIPNFFPEFSHGASVVTAETIDAVGIFSSILGKNFWALELNFSCPNSGEDFTKFTHDACLIVEKVKFTHPKLIIIAKVSMLHPHQFSIDIKRAGADVIHAVNTVPWSAAYPGISSPLADFGGGGVSGPPAHELAFPYCFGLRHKIEGPMIWGCVANTHSDVDVIFNEFGDEKNSVSICTAAIRNTGVATEMIKRFNS